MDGEYPIRTFHNKEDVWDVIRLLIEETEELNNQGQSFNIAESVMAQLPFFACTNVMLDEEAQKTIARFVYSRDFNVPPYKGSYGEQPKKWIERSFILKSLMERQKAKAMKNG